MTTMPHSPNEHHNASIDADPFLLQMPEKDYYQISLDETPLPMPDELPPECNDDDFECLQARAAIIEQLAAEKAVETLKDAHGAAHGDALPDAKGAFGDTKDAHGAAHGTAKVGAADPNQPAINMLKSAAKPPKPPKPKRRVQGAQTYSPGRAMRDACFQSVMFFPRKIMMVGHWAHDLKMGNLSGRKVIGILSIGCLILLALLMVAAVFRSNSLRGLL